MWLSSWDLAEKAMALHSSALAWKIPWMEEPVRLQTMGSLRVGHDWATSLSLFIFMRGRRKWQPTPVFLPGKSHGWRSLLGYNPWVAKSRIQLSDFTFTVTIYFMPFYPQILQCIFSQNRDFSYILQYSKFNIRWKYVLYSFINLLFVF